MKPLSTYIEFLLMTRHYAFVPGLGGFMFQEEPARLMLGGRLMPPLRMLKYNRFMDHDDGMLANIVMRAEHLSYDEANQSIRLSVNDLLNRVQHEGRCALGRLGFVFFDEECHIAFRAADQVDQDPVYYGMAQLNVRTWRDEERQRKGITADANVAKGGKKPVIKRGEGIVELPFRWLLRAAVVALVITFLLVKFMPWGDSSDNKTNYANLVDTDSFFNPRKEVKATLDASAATTSTTVADNAKQAESRVADVPEASVAQKAASNVVENRTATASDKKNDPIQTLSASQIAVNGKTYIVVVGSCQSLKEAERLVRRLKRKGYDDLEIFEREGRYRVYINQFTQKKEAIDYLYELRATSPFTDAWLLAVRPEKHTISSLHIIKNKDNDKLPMELSHLNKSAERDQG